MGSSPEKRSQYTVNEQELRSKIKILSDSVWEGRANNRMVDDWLENFEKKDRIDCLFLLSKFMYFGNRQIRELLNSLYRDLYRSPILHEIRKSNEDTLDSELIEHHFEEQLKQTKFFGAGNPSESGCHLLYYLRQENNLPKTLFAGPHEVFKSSTDTDGIKTIEPYDKTIQRYVFIDDFCGTGVQSSDYLKSVVNDIKQVNSSSKLSYLVLFGTTAGLQKIKNDTDFDIVESVLNIDHTFKVFNNNSRYFKLSEDLLKQKLKLICMFYGISINENHPLGYENSQLLIGFHHNTPDNTLPIFWCNKSLEPDKSWTPIFKRYDKKYEW